MERVSLALTSLEIRKKVSKEALVEQDFFGLRVLICTWTDTQVLWAF